MAAIYMLFITLILLCTQFLFGSIAIHLPLCACGIFYISTCYSYKDGAFWAVFSGLTLDLFYNRIFFGTTLALLTIAFFADYWRRQNDTLYPRHLIIPGLVVAFINLLPIWIYRLTLYNTDFVVVLKEMLPVTIFSLSLNSIFLPLLALFLDKIGKRLNLPEAFTPLKTAFMRRF
jgi:cell shape-determining protein MreD